MYIKRVSILFCVALLFASSHAHSQNLVANGDFEAGLTDWSIWTAPGGFWADSWLILNDCDIWIPTDSCPFEGSISYSQKKGNDASNAHGGIYQTLNVQVGRTYNISGFWSGGVSGNASGNNTWWEVVIYDGSVTDAIIDQAPNNPPRENDVLIAKKEQSNLGQNEGYQFQWESFSDSFVAKSNTVTLAFKTGSFYTYEAAGYLDQIEVNIKPDERVMSVPTLPHWAIIGLSGLLILTVGFMTSQGRRQI